MSRKKKKDIKYPQSPWVSLTWKVLDSKAYMSLPYSAQAFLPRFYRKVPMSTEHPERHSTEFNFTFSEAKEYGMPPRTFESVIEALIDRGFIDPVLRGGLKSNSRSKSRFRLSKRWEFYGHCQFKKISWKEFGQRQIENEIILSNLPSQKNKNNKKVCGSLHLLPNTMAKNEAVSNDKFESYGNNCSCSKKNEAGTMAKNEEYIYISKPCEAAKTDRRGAGVQVEDVFVGTRLVDRQGSAIVGGPMPYRSMRPGLLVPGCSVVETRNLGGGAAGYVIVNKEEVTGRVYVRTRRTGRCRGSELAK